MNLLKLDLQTVEIEKIQIEVEKIIANVGFTLENQICLTHSHVCQNKWHDGAGSLYYSNVTKKTLREHIQQEKDFSIFNQELKGSYLETIYLMVANQFTVGRTRIMHLPPRYSMTWHKDLTKRIHLAVQTNEHARLLFEDGCCHVPLDGNFYMADTTKPHSSMNGHKHASRYHLLFSLSI